MIKKMMTKIAINIFTGHLKRKFKKNFQVWELCNYYADGMSMKFIIENMARRSSLKNADEISERIFDAMDNLEKPANQVLPEILLMFNTDGLSNKDILVSGEITDLIKEIAVGKDPRRK